VTRNLKKEAVLLSDGLKRKKRDAEPSKTWKGNGQTKNPVRKSGKKEGSKGRSFGQDGVGKKISAFLYVRK